MASVLAQVGAWADVDIQLTDNQYLWDDLAVVLVLAMSMFVRLYGSPRELVLSDCRRVGICQRIRHFLSENCSIFVDYGVDDPDDPEYDYEDTLTWLFAHLSYLGVAIAFNIKDPFRLPFWTNRIYTVIITVEIGLNLWFLLDNSETLEDKFQVMPMPSSFHWSLFGLFVAVRIIAIGWEMFATRTLPRWWQPCSADQANTVAQKK
ncbi:unnamed protein product [Phytophthora lilii]|uniref:Unnamed protein product n=1 Tax=Phytophthora lilii TaxID=2077276 RepID=A0A9W6XNQ6_9STRA|nr:unnamed protein product [Phytophthora lilii]